MKRTEKPWGHEELWALAFGKYAGKLLVIEKGQRLSLQYHSKKHETIMPIRGMCRVVIRGERRDLGEFESLEIPPKTEHRIEAPYGKVTLVEVSTTELNDVVRIEDDYKRVALPKRKC